MGSKKTNHFQILANGVMATTATIASAVQNVENFDNVGLEVIWTGTPTGTISVRAAIFNPYPNPYSATNPIPAGNELTFDPALAQPAGSAGRYLIDINQIPFPYFQVIYTNASGTGVLNVYAFEKDLN